MKISVNSHKQNQNPKTNKLLSKQPQTLPAIFTGFEFLNNHIFAQF